MQVKQRTNDRRFRGRHLTDQLRALQGWQQEAESVAAVGEWTGILDSAGGMTGSRMVSENGANSIRRNGRDFCLGLYRPIRSS